VTWREGVVGADVARGLRASAIGLTSAVSTVTSSVEALCDSGMPPETRERRSHELYGQLGDVRLALSQLEEAVLPPPATELAVVEPESVVRVPTRRWIGRHR
jgi:hypothetical protein